MQCVNFDWMQDNNFFKEYEDMLETIGTIYC